MPDSHKIRGSYGRLTPDEQRMSRTNAGGRNSATGRDDTPDTKHHEQPLPPQDVDPQAAWQGPLGVPIADPSGAAHWTPFAGGGQGVPPKPELGKDKTVPGFPGVAAFPPKPKG